MLQIHGGCDVRGGYTDARLFYLPNHCLPLESVCGTYQQQEVYNQDEGDILYYNDTDEKINVITDSITLSLA